ncbi:GMC oxidoreductase [Streptomyces fuscichromogenes]|uniref:GMC oxidoreductase n=1 Tax=Streptomyces fuscichromogenes TaxID=1324013 RepID=UPI0037FA5D28
MTGRRRHDRPAAPWARVRQGRTAVPGLSIGDATIRRIVAYGGTDGGGAKHSRPTGSLVGDAVDLHHGRVLGHRGLYVLDGARIPGSTGGCNPSMTIAGLAEHRMATVVRQDAGRVF